MCCVSITIHDENHWESDHEHPLLHALFLVLHKLSSVSVVFDFNASLNDVAPVSPMLLPVDLMRMEESDLLMDTICVLSFVFTYQIEFSDCCV